MTQNPKHEQESFVTQIHKLNAARKQVIARGLAREITAREAIGQIKSLRAEIRAILAQD